MNPQVYLQNLLQNEFEKRRVKNPSFSIRSFAKRMDLSPTTLCLILNGKRKISGKLARKISDKLMIDPLEQETLLSRFKMRKTASDSVDLKYLQLTADQHHVTADWKAFAILNLLSTTDFKNNPVWIADRLSVPKSEVLKTLNRLRRLGMITTTKDQKLKRSAPRYITTDEVADPSIRKSHHQTLELAAKALDTVELDLRDFTWLTLPLDLSKMEKAKELIRNFRNQFYACVSEESKPTEVYRLSVQLIPLTAVRRQSNKNGESHE